MIQSDLTQQLTMPEPQSVSPPGMVLNDSCYPLRWRRPKAPRWPQIPSLRGYWEQGPCLPWVCAPTRKRQLQGLASFGLVPVRSLTRGEAHYLLAECLREAAKAPLDIDEAIRIEKLRVWHEQMETRELCQFIRAMARGKLGKGLRKHYRKKTV